MIGRILVLDHGFVELVDHMGDDHRIVEAARLSVSGENVRAVSDDRGLIRYLMRHRHTSPFEKVVFEFHCKMPIFVARQWIRHRTGAFNELSARYSELPEEFYVPKPEDMNVQAQKNKQGRGEEVIAEAKAVADIMHSHAKDEFRLYHRCLEMGMARELARINLPLSTYTAWYWTVNLHNLLHFLGLRMDPHAQMEIRAYADALASIVQEVCPLAWEAFVDFRLEAMTLSRYEVQALRAFLSGAGYQAPAPLDFPTKRESDEWDAKWKRLKGDL